ncbi:MAG: ABC transporter permease subunit [Planctomycetota bacterium]
MTRLVLLRHELTRLGQAPRTTVTRSVLFAATLAIAALSVPWGAEASQIDAAFASLFPVFWWAEMALALFVVPAIVATDIPVERERGTLELLLACPQTERDVLVGKYGSQLAQAAGILGALFPLGFAAVAFGGISLDRALFACVGIALTAGLSAAIAIRVSITASKSANAARSAVLLNGGLFLVTWILGAVVTAYGKPAYTGISLLVAGFLIGMAAYAWFRGRAPFVAAFAATAAAIVIYSLFDSKPPTRYGSRLPADPLFLELFCPWLIYKRAAVDALIPKTFRIQAAWFVHLFAIAIVLRGLLDPRIASHLSAHTRSSGEDEGRAVAARPGAAKARVKPKEPAEEEPEKPLPHAALKRPGRGPGLLWTPRLPILGNPVYWRETLRHDEHENARVGYWAAAVAAICIIPAISPGYDRGALWGGSHGGIVFETALLALIVTLNSASTLAPEFEKGTLSLLLNTGYPAHRVLAGKLRAAFLKSWPIGLVTFLHLGLITIDVGWLGPVLALIAGLTVASVAGIAVCASYFARRQRLALPLSLVLPFLLWGVPPLIAESWPRAQTLFRDAQPFALMTEIFQRGAPLSVPHDPAALFLAVTLATSVGPFLLVTWGMERRMRA